MLSKVQIICFAASYAVALALEISRLMFRSGIRGVVLFGFVGAGWVAHTAYLYYRAVRMQGSPLSSYYDWLLLAAWVLVLAYFYLAVYHPKLNFGIFLLPLVLALIGAAALTSRATFDVVPASKSGASSTARRSCWQPSRSSSGSPPERCSWARPGG